ncbi:MAG TPA: Wzz/FepE/Etk N-terminal domain-containing protein, partial [Candidatus Udaeobacter sp.]|nr:Wzz/FepE/Etk N-terminal domain-containing protein [Candidatus Udaeobacter sp.]
MLEFADYFDVLKKRKWVLLVWLVVGLVGAGVAFLLLPKVYRSSTLILVESQKVPTDYIKPMAVDTIEER